ncbi:hypothetical protein [Jongsikchunia kroppenstedtii]|uniref:hypothetical protein n=1 Tax=Jongsikchunia kroppenstedtii TaxID=1121721 RepID=UPI000378E338|nr:hypothetical protein [Jongsikchunia kroppenstedtii]
MSSDTPAGEPRMPTQAELDAADLAELAEKQNAAPRQTLRPRPPTDPGPPPPALRWAMQLWIGAAVCAAIGVIYGFARLGTINDLIQPRLREGVTKPDELHRVDSMAHWIPAACLVGAVILLAIQYPLLAAIGRHHSRNCRNFYVAAALAMLLSIPIGLDLLFGYHQIWVGLRVLGWIQFGLLAGSVVCLFGTGVNKWLPRSERIRPTALFRPGNHYK